MKSFIISVLFLSGAILMVLRKVAGDWRIFAESVSSGPVVSIQ
jgi:hypothetical protein